MIRTMTAADQHQIDYHGGQYPVVDAGRGIHLVSGRIEVVSRMENRGATRLHYYPLATGSSDLTFLPDSEPGARWGIGSFVRGGGAPPFDAAEWGLEMTAEDETAVKAGRPGVYRAVWRMFHSR